MRKTILQTAKTVQLKVTHLKGGFFCHFQAHGNLWSHGNKNIKYCACVCVCSERVGRTASESNLYASNYHFSEIKTSPAISRTLITQEIVKLRNRRIKLSKFVNSIGKNNIICRKGHISNITEHSPREISNLFL